MQSYIHKYFFFAFLIVAIAVGFIILWPFLTTLIIAAMLAVVLYPMYQAVKGIVRSESLASVLTIAGFLAAVFVPVFLVTEMVIDQAHSMARWWGDQQGVAAFVGQVSDNIAAVIPIDSASIAAMITGAISKLSLSVSGFFVGTVTLLVSTALVSLSLYYFLKEGASWKKSLVHLSPLSEESNEKIAQKVTLAINGIIRGRIFIAVIQGLLIMIGFTLFHVPHAALWGTCAAVASLIPIIGSTVISVPALAFLVVIGHVSAALGLGIWLVCVSAIVNGILSPLFVSRVVAIHPLLVLFSILGGLSLLGPVGIIIGPLVISVVYALLSVYSTEIKTT